MDIKQQVDTGKLVCPKTKQKLVLSADGQWLVSEDRSERYILLDEKVPIMLIDPEWAKQYVQDSSLMLKQYSPEFIQQKKQTMLGRLEARFYGHYRSTASNKALNGLLEGITGDKLCLSIGGGPDRLRSEFINLNIGAFPNVDIVSDAHLLPYADDSVDAIYCEAVLEHLHDPQKAAKEMLRVLKPGSKAFICTPFLQAYHGYPHHYQNFTLTGQRHLFETEGFEIIDAGTCVGPAGSIADLIMMYIGHYSPPLMNKPLRILWSVVGHAIKSLDKTMAEKDNAYVLAATTFVLIKKAVPKMELS